MLITLFGIVTLVRPELSNTESPMFVTPQPMVTLLSAQPAKAPLLRLITLLGIVTLVTFVRSQNAKSPMVVTGRPPIWSGMFTAPPGPVYPVIVIAPLLVM